MNMIKVLWCRFHQCLGTLTILFVEASSKTRLSRHLSHYVFGIRNFENTEAMRIIFFSETFKISATFQKCSKSRAKIVCFSDNCIWIVIVKLSLLRTGCFSLVANVLTSSPKKSHVNRRDFFENNFFCQWPMNIKK